MNGLGWRQLGLALCILTLPGCTFSFVPREPTLRDPNWFQSRYQRVSPVPDHPIFVDRLYVRSFELDPDSTEIFVRNNINPNDKSASIIMQNFVPSLIHQMVQSVRENRLFAQIFVGDNGGPSSSDVQNSQRLDSQLSGESAGFVLSGTVRNLELEVVTLPRKPGLLLQRTELLLSASGSVDAELRSIDPPKLIWRTTINLKRSVGDSGAQRFILSRGDVYSQDLFWSVAFDLLRTAMADEIVWQLMHSPEVAAAARPYGSGPVASVVPTAGNPPALPIPNSDVDENIPAGSEAGPFDVAVVIGNRHYTVKGVPDVDFAEHDATTMRDYLIKELGYKPENILFEPNATLAEFNELFGTADSPHGKLFNYVKPRVSSVFIYYTGHGAPDLNSKDAYFVPTDGNPSYIAASGYRLDTFYTNLGKIPAARFTVVLDTCFSGNSGHGLLFKNVSPALLRVKKGYRGPINSIIITAGTEDQVATWYPDKGHSLFTYFFLKGMRGEADANGDHEITSGELKAYLAEHVPYMARRLSGFEQTPVVTGGDDVLMLSLSGR
jgi:Caspase domain